MGAASSPVGLGQVQGCRAARLGSPAQRAAAPLIVSDRQADAVAAHVLGAVEGGVGNRHQLLGAGVAGRYRRGGADADGDVAGRTFSVGAGRHGQALEPAADALGHDGGALERLVGQDHGKLFAPVAGHQVVGPHFAGHGVGDAFEAFVAAQVAVGVVVGLEIVDV